MSKINKTSLLEELQKQGTIWWIERSKLDLYRPLLNEWNMTQTKGIKRCPEKGVLLEFIPF